MSWRSTRAHGWLCHHSRRYRWANAWFVMYGVFRLNGYSRIAAAVLIIGNRLCGTPMYYYPKRERARIAEREPTSSGVTAPN